MNPRLPALVDLAADLAVSDPAGAVDYLCREEAATCRFVGGAYVFRMAGLAGSSTIGRASALASWHRLAQRRLEGAQ